ncbi:MAG: hypothetical protein FAZ92_03120 [Accumulibacter sp.]|nr:MAG: hypothetical protein FAZ92_03120 [Accumulibacter sp.]
MSSRATGGTLSTHIGEPDINRSCDMRSSGRDCVRRTEGEKRARSAHEPQVPGLHGQPQRCQAQGGRQGPRQAQGPRARTDPSDKRHHLRRRRRRAWRSPAWLESVLRHHRGAAPFARPRQVGTTQVSLPSLESNAGERAIGNCANVACLCVQRGMPASPHTVRGGCRRRRLCRSCYPCASSNKWDCRALRRGRNLLHRTAGYVTRSSGGVGEAARLSPIPIGLPEGRVNENALHQSNM